MSEIFIRPFFFTFNMDTLAPSNSTFLKASRTHLCSVLEAYKMIFSPFIFDIIPFIARLLDSVAPEVKTISSLSAPISFAISVLAFSISLIIE